MSKFKNTDMKKRKNAHLPKLELETSLLVKDLDPVVVCVGHNDVVLRVHGHTAGLRELTLQDAKLAKLAMVDHLLPLDLAFWWVEGAAVAHWVVLQLWGARRHRGRVDGRLREKLRCQLHHPVVGRGRMPHPHPFLEPMRVVLVSGRAYLSMETPEQRIGTT